MSSYTTEINSLSRTKVEILKIRLGFCRHSYGVAPCTASLAEKCFNTFPTCQDKPNYSSIGKEYKFCSANLPASVINDYGIVFPYIKSISDLPTEIKEEDTVVKRLKVQLFDDTDRGIGIDPYWEERNTPVSFWKTFIQRNKNYRNGRVELWEGFAGVAEDQFQLKFAGKIDNFEFNNSIALIEAVDLLKELSEIKYPLKIDARIAEDMPMIFEAHSEGAMLALNAITNDYCKRTDFDSFSSFTATEAQNPVGDLDELTSYRVRIISYDANDRPTNRSTRVVTLSENYNAIDCAWTAVTGASYYRIYLAISAGNATVYEYYWQVTGTSYTILSFPTTYLPEPVNAERYYQLTGTDPSDIADWTYQTNPIFTVSIEGNQISDLPSSGYVRINKEVIYYASITLTAGVYYLYNISRGQFDTEIDYHYEGAYLAVLYYSLTPTNPFTMLKTLLNLAGIDNAYIEDTFDQYGQDWGMNPDKPKVTLKPIIKDEKLSRLYFDLVRLVNCFSWVNENGKVDIQDYDFDRGETYINDEANIISGSVGVDYNDESRMTRWILFWNRFDIEGGVDESDSYSRINIVVDADAEDDNEYGDIKEDIQYCLWFDDEIQDVALINTYVDALLQKRATRTRDAQEIVNCQLEIKDDGIKTGYTVYLSTKHLKDIYGNDYANVPFRVIKKEKMKNKLSLELLRRF